MEVVDACTDCRKYNGALAVEVLKQALAEEGIATSRRDSYMRSLDIEWDLLVLRACAKPAFNLLYEADQVKVAVEVKLSGVVGKTIDITRSNFETARGVGVKCCYVSFCDHQNAASTTEAAWRSIRDYPARVNRGRASQLAEEFSAITTGRDGAPLVRDG